MGNLFYSYVGLHLAEQTGGCRLKAFKNPGGLWTCGYGHTHNVGPSTICTLHQAEEWLKEDVQKAAYTVNRLVLVPLTQDEFDALVDFVFNLGAKIFESSSMLDTLNLGHWKAAAEQFKCWKEAGGQEVANLLLKKKGV